MIPSHTPFGDQGTRFRDSAHAASVPWSGPRLRLITSEVAAPPMANFRTTTFSHLVSQHMYAVCLRVYNVLARMACACLGLHVVAKSAFSVSNVQVSNVRYFCSIFVHVVDMFSGTVFFDTWGSFWHRSWSFKGSQESSIFDVYVKAPDIIKIGFLPRRELIFEC